MTLTEVWAWGAAMGLTVASVEVYIFWRIRKTANRLREVHRHEDCSRCLVATMKSQQKAEHAIRVIGEQS